MLAVDHPGRSLRQAARDTCGSHLTLRLRTRRILRGRSSRPTAPPPDGYDQDAYDSVQLFGRGGRTRTDNLLEFPLM